MPFLFKLARRVARLRAPSVLLATAAIVGACESTDPALSGPNPTHPSFATATGLPAGVTDLAVVATTDSAATLAFTEVDDGTGAPASYDIRLAPAPLVWGSTVPSVKRGTCATPVVGTAIGTRRSCTVLGLTTGMAYGFQLVTYRGTLLVNAVFGPLSNVASATARTPATTAPGSVTDLKVAAAVDTMITLSFTEVTDGSGKPASYDVRYVASSALIWGASVPAVIRGTCATPVAGTAISTKRTCTVAGLTAATTYTFQLVAYRGTLNVNAVFGALSNVATGSTATAGSALVASVSLAPGTASLLVGGTQQLVATLKDANGNVLTGRAIWWTSSTPAVATVGGTGLVRAIAPGSATITAAGDGKSGTATITVTTQPPVATGPGAVTDLKVASTTDTAATLAFTEMSDGAGKAANYDVRYVASATMPWGGTPSVTRGTCATPVVGTAVGAKRTCTVLGLSAGTTYSFELVSYRGTLNVNAVFGGLSNVATGATTGSTSGGGSGGGGVPGGGTVLLQENFQDAGFSGRGWYDDYILPVTTAQHMPGATSALELRMAPGATGGTFGTSARHLFPATSTLYVSYWVKYSDNWVGSASPDHPHEFYVLSNQDGQYAPLADDWLTTYIETNFMGGAGTPRISVQDNLAINRSMGTTPLNLIGVTEQRSVSGCNGMLETNLFSECYGSGTYNDKQFNRVGTAVFKAQPGAGYKGNWNHVEVYLAMNSIVGGVGIPDGVIQYWLNGVLAIDRHDVMFRTGARANLAFAQFVIGPYIGGGSPVDQTMWVDNLTLATRHP